MNKLFNDWQKDSDNYKWGIFYFNPQDPRLIVPKRMPYAGWTLNFANKYSSIVILIILGLAFISSIIPRLFK